MGRSFGLIAVIVVVGIGGYVYTKQMQRVTAVGSVPTTTIDVTAVRNDLLALANAERQYWASNAKYVSLEELHANGGTTIPVRPNYSYSTQATESSFKIVAVYSGPDPKAPKRMAIDETMSITTE